MKPFLLNKKKPKENTKINPQTKPKKKKGREKFMEMGFLLAKLNFKKLPFVTKTVFDKFTAS